MGLLAQVRWSTFRLIFGTTRALFCTLCSAHLALWSMRKLISRWGVGGVWISVCSERRSWIDGPVTNVRYCEAVWTHIIKPGISHWHNYLDVWSAHKSCHWKNKDSTHIQIRNAKSTWQIYLDTTKGFRTIFAMLYIFWCSIKLVPGIELVVFPMMHVTVSLIFSQCS